MPYPLVVDFAAKPDNPYAGTGLVWHRVNNPTANQWYSIAYSPIRNLFVAVSQNGVGNRATHSNNLIDWTTDVSAADNNWECVRWGHDRFVAVSSTGVGNRAMYSTDGITWTIGASANDVNWTSVVYADTLALWVAVASTGAAAQMIMTSADGGANWTARTAPTADAWQDICWSKKLGLLVAVANTGVGVRVMTSPDAINWTTRVNPVDNNWASVAWSEYHGLFVAGADSGVNNRIMTSPDGINWTIRTSAITDIGHRRIATNSAGDRLVAVSSISISDPISYSPDCVSWANVYRRSHNYRMYDVCFGQGKFVAVDQNYSCFWVS